MVFLDIETQNDFKMADFKMKDLKVSYVGVIDYETSEEMDFWEADMDKLHNFLKNCGTIVGYNIFGFDMPVLANYMGPEILEFPQLDLMSAAYKSLGFRPKLDDLASATLGYGKSGSGYDAVRYYAGGEFDKLKEYCMMDVKLTLKLYDFGLENGYIKYYDRGGFVQNCSIDWKLGEKISKTNPDVLTLF